MKHLAWEELPVLLLEVFLLGVLLGTAVFSAAIAISTGSVLSLIGFLLSFVGLSVCGVLVHRQLRYIEVLLD